MGGGGELARPKLSLDRQQGFFLPGEIRGPSPKCHRITFRISLPLNEKKNYFWWGQNLGGCVKNFCKLKIQRPRKH